MSNIICLFEDVINFVKMIMGNAEKVISRIAFSETPLKAEVNFSVRYEGGSKIFRPNQRFKVI